MKLILKVISAGTNFDHSLSVTLNQENATLGRREGNTLVLPDTKRWISGQHAVVEYRAPNYFLTDTSTNGIMLNQKPLGAGNSVRLNHGDQFYIGDYLIDVKIIQDEAPVYTTPINSHTPAFPDPSFNAPHGALSNAPSDPIQNMIDSNPLIPDDWRKPANLLDDPFDSLGKPGGMNSQSTKPDIKDFDHIEPFKAAFEPPLYSETPAPVVSPTTQPGNSLEEDWFDLPKTRPQVTTSIVDPFDFSDLVPPAPVTASSLSPPVIEPPPPQIPVPGGFTNTAPKISIQQTEAPISDPISATRSMGSPTEIPIAAVATVPPIAATPTRSPLTSAVHPVTPASNVLYDDLLKHFLTGAKLENSPCADNLTPESFHIIGKLLRESVQGAQEVLRGRAKIKNEMHLDVTVIRARENNPIKFSVSAEEALAKLLAPQDKGYLAPDVAIKEAFDDIRAHQYAVIAGMRTALLAVLKRFDPKKLEHRLQEESPIGSKIPIHRQAKLWDDFEKLYQNIEQEAEDNFYHLFGETFAETYEEQMQTLKKTKPDGF